MAEHSPLPWELHDRIPNSAGILITARDGEIGVCRVIQTQSFHDSVTGDQIANDAAMCRANAEFIFRACNVHGQLVAALEAFVDCTIFEHRFDHCGAMNATQLGDRDTFLIVRNQARAALAAAKGTA